MSKMSSIIVKVVTSMPRLLNYRKLEKEYNDIANLINCYRESSYFATKTFIHHHRKLRKGLLGFRVFNYIGKCSSNCLYPKSIPSLSSWRVKVAAFSLPCLSYTYKWLEQEIQTDLQHQIFLKVFRWCLGRILKFLYFWHIKVTGYKVLIFRKHIIGWCAKDD